MRPEVGGRERQKQERRRKEGRERRRDEGGKKEGETGNREGDVLLATSAPFLKSDAGAPTCYSSGLACHMLRKK